MCQGTQDTHGDDSFPGFTHPPTADLAATAPATQADGGGEPGAGGAATSLSPAEPLPRLEGYRVIDRLGEGGMGTVWRAVQLSTKRPVALKLMGAAAFGSDAARHRFEREVELTARLEHPHVARVYDSGVHYGVLFYAMELVEGSVPLDDYARSRGLGIRPTVALMRVVCSAVQHAHQRGVIHRDLKPNNVLVTPDGQPKVLDFGLAKAVLEGQQDSPNVTVVGEVAGTPAYMSPEQAAGRTREIDTRSDVYSLGVILYRLLTGKSPHDLSGDRMDLLRRISESEVARPRSIRRDLDRELESILLKALAREPDRRYGTAGELADELGRYLNHEPVTARPPTATYQLKKFARRHKALVAGIAAIFGVLVGGVVTTTWQARRASRFAGQSEVRRVEAERLAGAEQRAADAARQAGAKAQRRLDQVMNVVHNNLFRFDEEVVRLEGSASVRRVLIADTLATLDQLAPELGDDEPRLREDMTLAYLKLGGLLGDPAVSNAGDTGAALAAFHKGLALAERTARAARAGGDDAKAGGAELNVVTFCQKIAGMELLAGHPDGALEWCRKAAQSLQAAQSLRATARGGTRGADASTGGPTVESLLASNHFQAGFVLCKLGRYPEGLEELRAAVSVSAASGATEVVSGLPAADYYRLVLASSAFEANAPLDEPVALVRRVLPTFQRLAAGAPNDYQLLFSLTRAHHLLAECLGRLGHADEAYVHALTAMEFVDRRLAAAPATFNPQATYDRALVLEIMGDVNNTPDDRVLAVATWAEAVRTWDRLADADASNAEFGHRRCRAYLRLAHLLYLLADARPAGADADRRLRLLWRARQTWDQGLKLVDAQATLGRPTRPVLVADAEEARRLLGECQTRIEKLGLPAPGPDGDAKSPPATRFRFAYRFPQPAPGTRVWERESTDTWAERYPDGKTVRFRVVATGSQGTVVRRADEDLDVLIPPLEDGKFIAFRQRGGGEWHLLGQIRVSE